VNDESNDGLNSDLNTINELSQLKRNKSADLNGVVADFFIESKQFISPFLCSICNHSFNTDIYPESWSKGAIILICKKVILTTHQSIVELLHVL